MKGILYMNDTKFYYQILVTTPDRDELIFWIRDEEIKHDNQIQLNLYVKKNLPNIKDFRKIRNVIVNAITKEEYDNINNWYVKNSKKRDYIVVTT